MEWNIGPKIEERTDDNRSIMSGEFTYTFPYRPNRQVTIPTGTEVVKTADKKRWYVPAGSASTLFPTGSVEHFLLSTFPIVIPDNLVRSNDHRNTYEDYNAGEQPFFTVPRQR